MRVILLGTVVWAGVASAAGGLESAEAILACAESNSPEKSFQQAAHLRVRQNGDLQREIIATFAGQRGRHGFLLNIGVTEPPDVAGTSILLRPRGDGRDDMKLYLPALRRVRTVTGAMAGEELLGTDFSYRDIKQVFGSFGGQNAELLEPGVWREQQIYRVAMQVQQAADGEGAPYERLTIGIDQASCVPLVIEFEDDTRTIVKRLEGDYGSMIELGERRMLGRYTMKNLARDSETQLNLGPPEFDERVARSAFHPNAFYNFHNSADRPEE